MVNQDEQDPLKIQNAIDNEEERVGYTANVVSQSEFVFNRHHRRQDFLWTKWKISWIIIASITIISGFMALLIPHGTPCNNRTNEKWNEDDYSYDDQQLPQLRSGSISVKNKSPREIGYMNLYIRRSIHDDFRRRSKQLRFPVARYDRHAFSLHRRYLSLSSWVSIFIDRETYQTIIDSPTEGVFMIPPLVNAEGQLYSIGELIYYAYASLVRRGSWSIHHMKILPYFRREKLIDPTIPRFDSFTRGFIGGIRTNYKYFNISRYQKPSPDESSSEEDEDMVDINSYQAQTSAGKNREKSRFNRSEVYEGQDMIQMKTPSSCDNLYLMSNFCARNPVDKLKREYLSSKLPHIEEDANETNPGMNNSLSLEVCNCQKAILTPSQLHEHGLFIILHLSGKEDTNVKNACERLSQLKDDIHQLHPDSIIEATLGMGYVTTLKWLSEANISFPKSFIKYKEIIGPTGKRMPYTEYDYADTIFSGGDVFVDIRSNRKDLCFELGKRFYQLISKRSIAQLDDTFGFAYMSSKTTGLAKDFIGFEDGNDNPEGYAARAKAALIGEEEDELIHVGGSFALTQKWKHNLREWNEKTQDEQQNIIGRTKGDGSIEIKPRLQTSHVGRTHIEEKGVEIEILRKSLPYGDLKEHGLFFVSYASNPTKYEKMLNSMVGNVNGIYDRLMDYSTPITGNYWFVPSKSVLEKLFSLTSI